MSPGTAIARALRRFATFSGRAPRSEYWWFLGFYVLGGLVLSVIDGALFGAYGPTADQATGPDGTAVRVGASGGPLASIFQLAMLLPLLAAGWRRMHDTGRRGLYLLYPIIASLGLTTFMAALNIGPSILTDAPATGAVLTIAIAIASLIVLVSPLVVLFWLARPSEPRTNEWGPVPAGVRA